MKSFTPIVLLIVLSITCNAQVGAIKSASSSHHSSGSVSGGHGGGDFGGGYNFMGNFLVNLAFNGIVQAQQNMLQRRAEVPSMVSFETMLQTAVQPSAYYIVNPRLRANWGLFSTDLRFNYLISEEIGGYDYLRTTDWQIVEINFVKTRDFTARAGSGVIQEAFAYHDSFAEWTLGLQYEPAGKFGGFSEYRSAEVRKEFSLAGQYRLFDKNCLHAFATAGFVYQRYYEKITTWGMQGGLILKIY